MATLKVRALTRMAWGQVGTGSVNRVYREFRQTLINSMFARPSASKGVRIQQIEQQGK